MIFYADMFQEFGVDTTAKSFVWRDDDDQSSAIRIPSRFVEIEEIDFIFERLEDVQKIKDESFKSVCLIFEFLQFNRRNYLQSSDDLLEIFYWFYLASDLFGVCHARLSKMVKGSGR